MSIQFKNLQQAGRVATAIQLAGLVIPEDEAIILTDVHSTGEIRIEPAEGNPEIEWRVGEDGQVRFRQHDLKDGADEWTVLETSTRS